MLSTKLDTTLVGFDQSELDYLLIVITYSSNVDKSSSHNCLDYLYTMTRLQLVLNNSTFANNLNNLYNLSLFSNLPLSNFFSFQFLV